MDAASKLVCRSRRFGDIKAYDRGLVEPITRAVRGNKPFLGICLGLQLVFSKSYEDGEHAGLNFFPGEVKRFRADTGVKIPHMGWNDLRVIRRPPLLGGFPSDGQVYFVHCFMVPMENREFVACETVHGEPFVSMIWQDNVFATQFHPEKSQGLGLEIVRRFAEL